MLFADLEVVTEPGTSARPAWWPSCAQLEHFPAQTPQLVVCPALHHFHHKPHRQHLTESLGISVRQFKAFQLDSLHAGTYRNA